MNTLKQLATKLRMIERLVGFWTLSIVQYSLIFGIFEYWTMDKVQKPTNSECYTPSSEPIRIYMIERVYLFLRLLRARI
jgi:hypothetical protein